MVKLVPRGAWGVPFQVQLHHWVAQSARSPKYGTDSHEPERPRHRDRYCQEEASPVPSRPLFHRGGQEVRHGYYRHRNDGLCPVPHDWELEDVRRCCRSRSLRALFANTFVPTGTQGMGFVDSSWRTHHDVVPAPSCRVLAHRYEPSRTTCEVPEQT